MIETRDAAKIGTTTHSATVTIHVELDDPDAYGNLGLEGRDEFFESAECESVEAAQRWCESFRADKGEVVCGNVWSYEWDESIIDDDEYGDVLDADSREVFASYGWRDELGWHWEDNR